MSSKRGKNKKFFVFFLLITILALPYFFTGKEPFTIDDSIRARIEADFIKLSDGYTCYQSSGPPAGPVVVLVHGFSTPMFIWDKTAPALADGGFRVLRYDLYGRGFSDRPDTVYDESLFDRQLVELLEKLDVREPVDLVGLSMGGAVAVIFASNHPEKVRRLALIDPAGFPVPVPMTAKLVRMPLLGEYLIRVIGDRVMMDAVGKNFYRPENIPAFQKRFQEQLQYRGYKRAILSTLRNFDLSNQQTAFEAVGKQSIPTLLLWGKEDQIVPLGNGKKIVEAIAGARFYVIENAGHTPHYERPEAVNPILAGFLLE